MPRSPPPALLRAGLLLCLASLAAGQTLEAEMPLNMSTMQTMLASSWSGSGYRSRDLPLYLWKPLQDMSDAECLPQTGYPSRCPIEMMSLELGMRQNEPGMYNFSMRIFGDVFVSSVNSQGYFGMPAQCRYSRNHTGIARLNISTRAAIFTIQQTTSDFATCHDIVTTQPGERCQGGSCYSALNGQAFEGTIEVADLRTPAAAAEGFSRLGVPPQTHNNAGEPLTMAMKLILLFPYRNAGAGGWANFASRTTSFVPALTNKQAPADQTFGFVLTTAVPYRPIQWFSDNTPKIRAVDPPFGPEEGGSVVTIIGEQFPAARATAQSNGSIVFQHFAPGGGAIDGGDPRECCEMRRVSDTRITCRLPRVSCITEGLGVPCPKPGRDFVNQTVSLAIRPNVIGFDGSAQPEDIDRFVSYEGDWEVVDEDLYGGKFVPVKDRLAGEYHILGAGREDAVRSCCPICPPGANRANCRITITQLRNGIYNVTVPEIMTPGDGVRVGTCDQATNYRNRSLLAAIETSTDPEGFTPADPLSVTTCADQVGPCSLVSRVSIRESCKQLVWATGRINTFLPTGETKEVHEWISDGQCDRRMRCVGGKCLWRNLAVNNSQRVFQRRQSSEQIGLQVDYKNPNFDPVGFLKELGPLVDSPDYRRLQILRSSLGPSVDLNLLGTTFAVRRQAAEFVRSQPALCTPDDGLAACSKFWMIIYIVSAGPGFVGSEKTAKANLTARASAPTGDPQFREINLMNVCLDLSGDPASRAVGILNRCIKIQYPGFLQFETSFLRVREVVWSYASLGVTRTGGSDLGVTVDYRTRDYPNQMGSALGLGVDFFSKIGQVRWIPGDALTKYIIVPIKDDDITELSETFEVSIFGVVNASMSSATQTAVVTIVGINDTPTPRYIENIISIIGAVVGVATIVPLALFAARLVRSIRRGQADKQLRSRKTQQRDVAIIMREENRKAKEAESNPKLGGLAMVKKGLGGLPGLKKF